MFDDEKIKLIEAVPEADMILVIWIKLLTLAGKKNMNGYIFLTENIPYTDEMIATLFNRPLNTVRLALETFKKFGMIEFNGEGKIKITNWEKHQNIEGLAKIREGNKIRQQRFRGQHLLGESEAECPYCGKYAKLTIDHIIPFTKGGSDDTENKILCCMECNQSKNNRDLAIFLNSKITLKEPINLNSITHNKKLMQHLIYENGKFSQVIIKDGVSITHSNTIEEDKIRLEEDKIRLEEDKIRLEEIKKDNIPIDLIKLHNVIIENGSKINFNYKTKNWENITEEDIKDWETVNINCNIIPELELMRQWLLDDKKRAKKYYRKFIAGWINRVNKKGDHNGRSNQNNKQLKGSGIDKYKHLEEEYKV